MRGVIIPPSLSLKIELTRNPGATQTLTYWSKSSGDHQDGRRLEAQGCKEKRKQRGDSVAVHSYLIGDCRDDRDFSYRCALKM